MQPSLTTSVHYCSSYDELNNIVSRVQFNNSPSRALIAAGFSGTTTLDLLVTKFTELRQADPDNGASGDSKSPASCIHARIAVLTDQATQQKVQKTVQRSISADSQNRNAGDNRNYGAYSRQREGDLKAVDSISQEISNAVNEDLKLMIDLFNNHGMVYSTNNFSNTKKMLIKENPANIVKILNYVKIKIDESELCKNDGSIPGELVDKVLNYMYNTYVFPLVKDVLESLSLEDLTKLKFADTSDYRLRKQIEEFLISKTKK